ncbi:MAG: hypothetical protein OXN17_02725 [Candidatus Poribacteria bacterium]|nr:hypothetical protein [Candidatus Poribacteria bacterium]
MEYKIDVVVYFQEKNSVSGALVRGYGKIGRREWGEDCLNHGLGGMVGGDVGRAGESRSGGRFYR